MAKVSASLMIEGNADTVYEKAKDIERLAQFLPDLEEVRILRKESQSVDSFWKGRFQGREVKWTERDLWDDEKRECQFFILEGDFKTYRGIWRFEPAEEGKTRVELEIEYDLGLPLVGALISAFLRKKMEENTQAMLLALKKSVEG
ncbi:MAG: SRPBCC family protein [Atribacterota bacterium]